MKAISNINSKVQAMSLAMKRILGVEPKKRIRTNLMIETEFMDIMRKQGTCYSDLVNVLLERELLEKKRL